jgi:hypothetical protein
MVWQIIIVVLAIPPAIVAVRQLKGRRPKPPRITRIRLSITLTVRRGHRDRSL